MESTPGPNEERWRRMLSGEDQSLVRGRDFYRTIPSPPRCKLCNAPFAGPGGAVMRHLGWARWPKNPRFCQQCHKTLAKQAVGGAEVEISVLFADIRGSTTMAETMRPVEFRAIVDRFYRAAEAVIVEADGLVDNELGDGILALFIPVWAGPRHAATAISAGRAILHVTGNDGARPWVPVGVGVHTGVAFVGIVSHSDEADDFTALGDTVNTRLVWQAARALANFLPVSMRRALQASIRRALNTVRSSSKARRSPSRRFPCGQMARANLSLPDRRREYPPPVTIEVQPVTRERWGDVLALFGERGASAGCWCMWFRARPHHSEDRRAQNRAMLQGLVMDDRVPGLLAYREGEPVGWVSVAPRPEYERIVGPAGGHGDGAPNAKVWSVVCFYIHGRKRGTGIATALLDAAVEHARRGGAQVLEAYPVEPDGRTHNGDAFTGLRSMFERLGFREVGRFDRWLQVPSIGDAEAPALRQPPGRPVMQLRLGRSGAPRRQAVAVAAGPGMPRRVSSAPKPSRSSTPT